MPPALSQAAVKDDTLVQVDKVTRWGDLESDEEESEEEEEEEEGDSDGEAGGEGEGVADGTQSQVSGYGSSLPSGIETPDVLDLRKGKAAGAGPSVTCQPAMALCDGSLTGCLLRRTDLTRWPLFNLRCWALPRTEDLEHPVDIGDLRSHS